MEITLSQGEVMPSACSSQMFLLHIHLLLPEAFTTSCFEPEHRTTIRCFSSPWTEAVLITQGDRVPPASWGWDFFLNTAREGLAEPSCPGRGCGEGWAVQCRWCKIAVLQWGCTKPALLQEKPVLPPCMGRSHSLPQPGRFVLAGWDHTQLGARGTAHPALASPEHNPGTQTLVLDQPAPVCFPAVRRAWPGQPAHCHSSWGALER